MKRSTLSIELFAKDGKAPTEFRIFAAGMVESTKGIFKFSDKSAESVMAAAKDWGNDYCVDYDHAMLSFFSLDPSESMRAAGWFQPEVRGGELWASNVSWTEKATGMLAAREARYISPAFQHEDDGTITELVNVALTNIPATKKQTPLVASGGRNEPTKRQERHMSKKNKVSAFTLYKLGLPPDAGEAEVMAALDGLQERARMTDQVRSKIETDARAKAEAELKKKKETEGEPDLATLAGKAAGDATQAEKTRTDSERRLNELTGMKTYGESLGVVINWKNQVAEVEKLQARIAELEQKGQGATAEALVEQGIREGKITPAQKELWLSIGKKDPEVLKGFIASASPVVPKRAAVPPEAKIRVALTAEQLKAAAKMGITDAKQLEKLSEQLAEAQALRAGAQ